MLLARRAGYQLASKLNNNAVTSTGKQQRPANVIRMAGSR